MNDVNLKINPGEFVFVVGASGAGKSTFIKLIIHEEKPSAGEVVVGNFKVSKLKRRNIPKLRRTMGIVFQDFRLIREKTVYENIAFAMHVVGASKKEIRKMVITALNIVGLSSKAKCYPDELSGGEQQRVALARALVNKPDLILADEPTGNVDPHMSYEIVELLTEINRHGTTVIMVTHEHQLVRDFGHRVIMIEDGAVVADDAPENISTVAEAPERKVSTVASEDANAVYNFEEDTQEEDIPVNVVSAKIEVPTEKIETPQENSDDSLNMFEVVYPDQQSEKEQNTNQEILDNFGSLESLIKEEQGNEN